ELDLRADRQADVERAEAALVVGRDRNRFENLVDLIGVETVLAEALAGAGCDQLLRARTCRHALGGDTDQPAGAALGADRGAEERVQLLRLDPRDRCGLVLREARFDRDLGSAGALAFACELG